ncbi:MAG: outer membrane beta-barrel protein [Bacteroidales bacterium]
MKQFNALVFFIMVICCHSVSYSQKITTGIYSGVNFSDIHGQEIGGKWSFKPGPVQGFNLGYSFSKTLGIQTGINFSTIYYEHKLSSFPRAYYPVSYSSIAPYYYPENEMMDFRVLRIPLLFTVSVPSELQFRMRAGIFFSFLQDYSLNNYNYYSSRGQDKPEKHDFGYIFSSGISYPFNEYFKVTFDIGYLTGRKKFLDNYKYRHGSSEFTLGIAYTGFLKNKNANITSKTKSDSSYKKVTVTFRGGMNYSWNKGSNGEDNYCGYTGPALGFSLRVPLGGNTSFQTGLSFERKGYSIKDSSTSFYKLIQNDNQIYYVDAKVQTDYAIIPALLSFQLGESDRVFFNTGPWLGLKLNARSVGTAYIDYHSDASYQLKKTIIYEDLEKAIKDYDLGWIFGFGVSIPVIEEYKVDLTLQYSTGFRDVFDISGTGEIYNQYDKSLSIRNRTISLILGFKIPSADR